MAPDEKALRADLAKAPFRAGAAMSVAGIVTLTGLEGARR